MKSIPTILLLCFFTPKYSSNIYADEWHVNKNNRHNVVQFYSEVIGFSFDGKTDDIDGYLYNPNSSVFSVGTEFFFDVNLTTMDTGIGKRDRDMRKVLRTTKWPKATFKGTIQEVQKDTLTQQTAALIAEGVLSVHGIDRNLLVTSNIIRDSEELYVNSEFLLSLSDFKIEAPQLIAFIKVSNEIIIRANFSMITIGDGSGSKQ